MWSREPLNGDAAPIVALAETALGQDPSGVDTSGETFGDVVVGHHGRIAIEYGATHARVAGMHDGSPVEGFIYAYPPVRLIRSYAELGPAAQQQLGQQLAEIELLAVTPQARQQGLGTHLLTVMEETLKTHGVAVVFAKVRGAVTARWYRRRGYQIAGSTETVVLRLGWTVITCDAGGDGHLLAVKGLNQRPTNSSRR